ncbi:MAG: hypothetical protein AAF399_04840, partial [Bacteroidota bacterium]
MIRWFHLLLSGMLGIGMMAWPKLAQADQQDRHVVVSLRMIGHQLLLHAGDLESRVLPIEREGDRYKIPFESEFAFEPGHLAATVDSMLRATMSTERYLVEVEECETRQVVYSYEMGFQRGMDIIPCSERGQPKGCYAIYLTLWGEADEFEAEISQPAPSAKIGTWGMLLLGSLLLGILIWRRTQGNSEVLPDHLVKIGVFQFDPHQLTLTHQEEITPLTSKEADLLALLHRSVISIRTSSGG